MIPQGKFLFLWKIRNCSGGNAAAIAGAALDMGLAGVSIKVAQCGWKYNLRWTGTKYVDDILPPLVTALRNVGLRVYGWHYVTGDDPATEALCILDRIQQLQLDGLDVDAEAEYKAPGKANAARIYMQTVRDQVGANFPIGLTSYRYPVLHPEFPWQAFCRFIDYHLPQVYWNPPSPPGYGSVLELNKSVIQLRAVKDVPIFPAGRAYIGDGHPNPTPAEMTDFMQRCKELDLPGFSFWAFDFLYLHNGGQARAQAIKAFQWPTEPPPQPSPHTLEERVTDLEIRVTNLGG